jgi:hypothetical protein
MRAHVLLAVPFAALLACTGASSARSSTTTTAAGRASTHSSSAASAQRATAPANWYSYHRTDGRSGYSPGQPTPTGPLRVLHNIQLDGAVYASPLVWKGITIVATENNTVYAFNAAYKQLWKRHLATPANSSQHPCGNIDPLGITGTPAFSTSTNSIYVAAEVSGNPPTHRLYAVNFSTGGVRWSRTLDFPGVDRAVMQQRGALLLIKAGVYIPFGGLAGDCGNYKGRVVRYSLTGSGATVFTVPTAREAGIWTPPGLSYDGTHLFAAVGNGAAGAGDRYDSSDSILELTRGLKRVDYFAPKNWAAENDGDVDLGSQGATVVGPWIFSAGKSGTAYVLRRSHLGGVGGQVSSASVCRSFGGTATYGSTVYVPCTDGVRAVSISSSGHMTVRWHGASNIAGSPVVGGRRVWSIDPGGTLYSLDQTTGQVKGSVGVGSTSRFATPALYGNHVVLGTLRGLVVVNYAF